MTAQEQINTDVQTKLALQDAKFALFMEEIKQQREDIRRAQEKHDADMREMREDIQRAQDRQDAAQARHDADMKEMREDIKQAQEKHDADMREMREDIKGTIKHIQNLTIASMVGIAAIAVATWVFVLTNNQHVTPPPNPPAQAAQIQNNQ